MFRKKVLILSLISICGFALECSNDDVTSSLHDMGTLRVLLTDATASYDAVNVTFSEVSVHFGNESSEADSSSGWMVISNESRTFNLLTLSNGATAVLGENTLEEGHYTQIRLTISDAEVVVDGTSYELDVPGNALKFVSGFDIEADTPTELIVDFDVARSIHQTGQHGNYVLRPTIRIIKNAATGSIGGIVTNYSDMPVAYAIAGVDTITSTPVDPDNGQFILSFLQTGTYSVAVTDSLGLSYTNPSVPVTAGSQTDLGTISLE